MPSWLDTRGGGAKVKQPVRNARSLSSGLMLITEVYEDLEYGLGKGREGGGGLQEMRGTAITVATVVCAEVGAGRWVSGDILRQATPVQSARLIFTCHCVHLNYMYWRSMRAWPTIDTLPVMRTCSFIVRESARCSEEASIRITTLHHRIVVPRHSRHIAV